MSHKCLGFALACAFGLHVLGSPAVSLAKPTAPNYSAPKAKAAKPRKAKTVKPKAVKAKTVKPKAANNTPAKTAARVAATSPQPARNLHASPGRRALVEQPPNPAQAALASSVRLEVTPSGPHATWEARVLNQSQHSVWIATDARLLWFEATVPGRKVPVVCRLPGVMLPGNLESARPRHLLAGESFSFRVDPRMFCFEKGDQLILVPGTFLRPFFGWPEQTQATWTSGKQRTVRLAQSMPFVVRSLTTTPAGMHRAAAHSHDESLEFADDEAEGAPDEAQVSSDDGAAFEETSLAEFPAAHAVPPGPSARAHPEAPAPTASNLAASTDHPPVVDLSTLTLSEPGLKQLAGAGFALDSTYIGWAHTRLREETGRHSSRSHKDLALEVSYGSDAPSPRDVTVAVTLRNLSDTSKRVYFRRDLITFSVVGPDGENTCSADDSFRAPERLGFLTLGPHQAETLTTRLLEFCDEYVFARPGFYYVSAQLNTETVDDDADRAVFRGRLASDKPRPVRVHTAELPFRARKRPTFASNAGSPVPMEAQAPVQVQQPMQPAQPLPPVPPPPPPEPEQ